MVSPNVQRVVEIYCLPKHTDVESEEIALAVGAFPDLETSVDALSRNRCIAIYLACARLYAREPIPALCNI